MIDKWKLFTARKEELVIHITINTEPVLLTIIVFGAVYQYLQVGF